MADMNFEEHCPCGNTIKVSGYSHHVQPQILTWRSIHNRHANTIAKTLAGPPVPKGDYDRSFTFDSNETKKD